MVLFRDAAHVLGVLLIILGVTLLAPPAISLIHDDGQFVPLLVSAVVTLCSGIALRFFRRQQELRINKRTGYLVVTVGWIGMSAFAMMPYIITGFIPSVTDAFFECMSGFTTTGASILKDIEALPPSVLFWRSLTQWIGGMGIIVLSVAILPLLGVGGIELFVAEAPGPTADKIHPRIQETAKRLWLLYVGLTLLCGALLHLAGMNGFDSVNHAMTTLATGGFSTKNASVAYWQSPAVHYVVALFMLFAGTNFTVLYFFLTGSFRKAWRSDEMRAYVLGVLGLVVLGCLLWLGAHGTFNERVFRDMLFQVVSLISTTGFVTADYTAWGPTLTFFSFLLLFAGASAGSTAGGIKVIRHLVFLKNSWLEFKRIMHPRGMVRIKIDEQVVAPRVLTHIMVFLLVYMATFGIGTLVVAGLGMDMVSAAGAVATSLGNIGPGLGVVGPVYNFSEVPEAAKWVLSFLMLLGRLELFSVLILFTPFFWRAN